MVFVIQGPIMKKFLLSIFVAVAMVSSATAQGISVRPEEFTSNPARYDGQTISVTSSIINLDGIDITATMGNTNGPASTGVGMGAPVTSSPVRVVRCSAPLGFTIVDIDFKSNPTFSACFLMPKAMYDQLPKGKDVTVTLMFKGSYNAQYTVTNFKP